MRDLALPATVATTLVVPLMVLEGATSTGAPRTTFAFPLFVILWLVAVMFVRVLQTTLRSAPSILLLPRIAGLALLGWNWASMVSDQMPCFLGASGC